MFLLCHGRAMVCQLAKSLADVQRDRAVVSVSVWKVGKTGVNAHILDKMFPVNNSKKTNLCENVLAFSIFNEFSIEKD